MIYFAMTDQYGIKCTPWQKLPMYQKARKCWFDINVFLYQDKIYTKTERKEFLKLHEQERIIEALKQ